MVLRLSCFSGQNSMIYLLINSDWSYLEGQVKREKKSKKQKRKQKRETTQKGRGKKKAKRQRQAEGIACAEEGGSIQQVKGGSGGK